MAYFKKQNSEYREINQNQKQVILQLQRDLSDKDRNIDNLIAQVNELIEDKCRIILGHTVLLVNSVHIVLTSGIKKIKTYRYLFLKPFVVIHKLKLTH
jgi:hypothetical protein